MMVTAAPRVLRTDATDNVAIVLDAGGIEAGSMLDDGLCLIEHVPQAHKVALTDLPEGAPIRRYGAIIGYASQSIRAGGWVHDRRMRMPAPIALDEVPRPIGSHSPAPPLEGYRFEGYRNADGTVGTRNLLGVAQTVQCTAGVVDHAVARIKAELLPRYPNVDDVVALGHGYGCGVAIDAPGADIPIRTLRNIGRNPNFGGELMVVGLGCEKLQPERLLGRAVTPIADERRIGVLRLQDAANRGFESMIAAILSQADGHLQRLDRRRRQTVPASELIVGVQCGGSDALSGVTANPAVGFCADLLVRAGATVLFSEVSEVRDALGHMTARAASEEVRAAMIREVAWFDEYLRRGGVDRSANTTPGNKQGGLSNIVEKALGSIVKSGSMPIDGVLAPGERCTRKGLIFAATPASDFICGTLQLAAGMNLHVFTTGRGTPYGLAQVPVIKVSTRTELAQRWHDLIDLDAGPITNGTATVASVGWALFEMILEVASGRRRTWAEHWKLHNDLILFNPAPVT